MISFCEAAYGIYPQSLGPLRVTLPPPPQVPRPRRHESKLLLSLQKHVVDMIGHTQSSIEKHEEVVSGYGIGLAHYFGSPTALADEEHEGPNAGSKRWVFAQ
jgi:hypothetical protein